MNENKRVFFFFNMATRYKTHFITMATKRQIKQLA